MILQEHYQMNINKMGQYNKITTANFDQGRKILSLELKDDNGNIATVDMPVDIINTGGNRIQLKLKDTDVIKEEAGRLTLGRGKKPIVVNS